MSDKPVDPIFDVLIPSLFSETSDVGRNSSAADAAWEPFQPWKCQCGQLYIVLSEKGLNELSSGNPEKLAADLKTDFYIYTKEPLHCRRCGLLLRVMHESDFAAADARHAANRKEDMAIPTLDELKLIAQEPEVCEVMKLNPKKIELASVSGDRKVYVEVINEDNAIKFVKLKTTRYKAYKIYFEQAGIQVDESLSMLFPMADPNR